MNKKIVKDRYPLPLIEDQLDKLQDASVFNTLDLRNGFFYVNVEENSKKYKECDAFVDWAVQQLKVEWLRQQTEFPDLDVNPREIHRVLLRPEKIIAWCGFWSGGIIDSRFFLKMERELKSL
ncbi:hypothetical protein Trydic_g21645 [Trypoxylus dichotomus]